MNEQLKGKTYPKQTETVTAEACAAYAAATNGDNPRYKGPEAVAPPLMAAVYTVKAIVQPLFDQELGIDLTRMVHGEQDMCWERAVRAGEQITTEARISDILPKGSGELLVVELLSVDEAGNRVARITSSFFVRGDGKSDRSEGSGKAGAEPESAGEPEWGKPGLEAVAVVAPDQARRYAEVAGDKNPIHLDDAFARSVGLPGAILHGLCSMAFVQHHIVDQLLEGDPGRLKRLSLRFSKFVLPGDRLTTRFWKTGPYKLRFETLNKRGEKVHTRGEAQVLLP